MHFISWPDNVTKTDETVRPPPQLQPIRSLPMYLASEEQQRSVTA